MTHDLEVNVDVQFAAFSQNGIIEVVAVSGRGIGAEDKFLRNLKDEPDERVLECMYVQALIAAKKAEYVRFEFSPRN